MKFLSPVQKQYEKWPYPAIPLWAKLKAENLWQINVEWIAKTLGRQFNKTPRIWIAGCGTFQPYSFSLANPEASILATDFSQASLEKAKTRCRWHRRKNVEFRRVDLNDETTFPDGKFDFIECYGVLMSLKNPGETLRAFHQRLEPGGILRVMVYTHYGRQRIFQIQKLAKLLGLGPTHRAHPQQLKKLLQTLDDSHPLKTTFLDYSDAQTKAGIVDGFLHASDRGFTGEDLADLLDRAGFDYGFSLHRPWGTPEEMARNLHLPGKDPAFWLHYLDLWQSLKSNFILCVVPKGYQSPTKSSPLKKHPLFDKQRALTLSQRWGLLKNRWWGLSLQSRTHAEPLKLTGREVRALLKGEDTGEKTKQVLGLLSHSPRCFFQGPRTFQRPSDPWKVYWGKSPNPLYQHLFDAYAFEGENREEKIARWAPFERPLEDAAIPWGLTPGETYRRKKDEIEDWFLLNKDHTDLRPISEVRLKDENKKLEALKRFWTPNKEIALPKDLTSLRILWILVLGHSELFLEFE